MSRNASSWTAFQLLAQTVRLTPEPRRRHNPRPPGVIRDGSATESVLALLETQPRRWWTHGQVMALTGRSTKAVGFALLYLRQLELVDVEPDGRNARYFRYRFRAFAHRL